MLTKSEQKTEVKSKSKISKSATTVGKEYLSNLRQLLQIYSWEKRIQHRVYGVK